MIASFFAKGQLHIDDSQLVVDAVKRLEGEGVIIDNITYSFDLEADTLTSPVGTFLDTIGVLGMRTGLLMTNGAAINAVGPNNESDADQINYPDVYEDDDLQSLILDEQVLQDLVIIEFDISVYANQLSFNYVFASEEYPEFLEFNDVFGFFISGPGIDEPENLALVPGTTTPVSVSNINQNVNNQYFVSNGTGETPFDNIEIQYDGYTTVLRARREVIPCETYHIKLAIADVDDSNLDSGVFLEEGSFNSKELPHFEVTYQHERFNHLIEGCNDAFVNVVRDAQDVGTAADFAIILEGSATEGVDFDSIPDSVFLSADQISNGFELNTILDSIADAYEYIDLTLVSDCEIFENFDKIRIDLREKFEMTLSTEKKCGPSPIVLNSTPIATDRYDWLPEQELSCFFCPSPSTNVKQNTNFHFDVYDSISTCEGEGSQFVNYEDIIADFEILEDECKTTLDFEFINKSTGADLYTWNFGDDKMSHQFSPVHFYNSALNSEDPVEFTVNLTATNVETRCFHSKREKIVINNPLFAPNIITPNLDFINDYFEINGINPECWTFELYNRWGKLVVEEKPFLNHVEPNDLSDGTYFFRVVNGDGSKDLKGSFNIMR